MINVNLDNNTLDEIKGFSRKKLNEYCKLNDVIGAQIFSILELQNKVIYYPIEDEDVWAFSEKISGKSFVWINTDIDYDKQVFAAAHELYHLWSDDEGEVFLKNDVEEEKKGIEIKKNELKANRFAAEFLINEELLLQEIRTYGINKNNIELKEILKLANLFVVPYKTMVKRLYEIKLLNKNKYAEFMEYTNEDIEIWRNRLGFSLPTRENKIGLNSLVDKAMELYEKKMITIEKLDYLLSLANLNLEKMGIKKVENYFPPSDDELDEIMEE